MAYYRDDYRLSISQVADVLSRQLSIYLVVSYRLSRSANGELFRPLFATQDDVNID